MCEDESNRLLYLSYFTQYISNVASAHEENFKGNGASFDQQQRSGRVQP